MPNARIRHGGYIRATDSFGLIARTVVTPDDDIEKSGVDAAETLLGEAGLPTAVIVGELNPPKRCCLQR
jgi:hypothetical protein